MPSTSLVRPASWHKAILGQNRSIVEQFGHTEAGVNTKHINNLNRALNDGDIAAFIKTLQIFFANIPNNITLKDEKYYQSLFYAILTLLGYKIEAEVNTNIGRMGTQTSARSLCSHEMSPGMGEGRATRTFNNINTMINCVLQTDKTIYISEFKLNDTCDAAMAQIHDKQYAQKYQNSSKNIVLLGVEFDQKTRNIGEYVEQVL
ncbi:MAG: hypothetical protein ACI8WB_004527 [Phenylobacterium sp.]|jgi:hypothetical protein